MRRQFFCKVCLVIFAVASVFVSMSCDNDESDDNSIEIFSFQGEVLDNEFSFSTDSDNDKNHCNWQYSGCEEWGIYGFSLLFNQNYFESISISTRVLDSEYFADNNLNNLFKVGYVTLDALDYDFIISVSKIVPVNQYTGIPYLYTTEGSQDEHAFYISNVVKYEIKSKKIYGYKVTANINANLYDESGNLIGVIKDSEFVFGITF